MLSIYRQTGEILGRDNGDAVEGCAAIVVISKEPTGHNGRIVSLDAVELLEKRRSWCQQ